MRRLHTSEIGSSQPAPSTKVSMRPIISHKNKYIYYGVPKVASISIRKMLAEFDGIEWIFPPSSNTKFEYVSQNGALKYPYFKFAFVRNPWDRLVSCYADKVIGGYKFNYHGMKFAGMEFKEFAKLVCSINDNRSDGHFKSQHTFIKHNIDFMGRFENLANDLDVVRSKLGIGIKEEHLMKSKRKTYEDYYDEDLKEMVGDRYKEDISKFGYKFGE